MSLVNSMVAALARHWPEYLIEAAGLGAFMVLACGVTVLLEHPASPPHQAIADPLARRMLIGLAMGLTAVGIIYSPWGKRSGAHINPVVTFTFWRLRKVASWDAVFYGASQFAGGLAGVLLAAALFSPLVAHPSVNYVATVPGPDGPVVAFMAELAISCGLMLTVLVFSNTRRLARFTGLAAGTLVAAYITVEAPLSGMSMNPARTLGSALPSRTWTDLWIYFLAPALGMLLAAEICVRLRGASSVLCAKLHHPSSQPCIFNCGYARAAEHPSVATTSDALTTPTEVDPWTTTTATT